MEMSFEMEGMEELLRAMAALPGLVAERVYGDGMQAASKVVRDEAKRLVPVRTGALRDSIRARRRVGYVETFTGRKRVPGGAAQVFAGGSGARHAVLVEYGTVHDPAKPFLEPALLSDRNRQLTAAAAAMSKAFTKIGRDLAAGRATRIVRRLAAE